MKTHDVQPRGSDRVPTFEHAVVADVMHRGVMSCQPDADLVAVARLMATHHIHAVVVSGVEKTSDGNERFVWNLLSDLDLVSAALDAGDTAEAVAVAGTEIIAVFPDDPLERAARLMVDHQLAHLLVISRETGLPIGVVSTLDIAGVIAWGEA